MAAAGASRSKCSSGCGRSTRSPTTSGPIMAKDIALFERRDGERARSRGVARVGRPLSRPTRTSARPRRREGRGERRHRVRPAERRHPDPSGGRVCPGRRGGVLERRVARRARAQRRACRGRRGAARSAAARDRRRRRGVDPAARRADARGRCRARRARPARSRSTATRSPTSSTSVRTALGLVIGARVERRPRCERGSSARGIPCCAARSTGAACTGPATSRCARSTARRSTSTSGSGSAKPPSEAGHFLAEAGFLLLQGVFTERGDGRGRRRSRPRAVDAARPDDGASWWAATSAGERYPCRILDFARQSRVAARAARRSALPRDRRAARRRSPPGRSVRRALRRGHRRRAVEAGRFGRGAGLPAVAQGLRARRPLDVLLGPHRRASA